LRIVKLSINEKNRVVPTGNFTADDPLPVASIHDGGFYVQGAFYPVKKRLELVLY
jgi:hypothetical protein